MRIRLLSAVIAGLAVPPLLLATAVRAQPVVTAFLPAANLRNAPRTGLVQVTFSQPLDAVSTAALKVFSHQLGGQRAGRSGAVSVSGNTLTFTPNNSLRAGETVHVSLTSAARTANGVALAQPRVFDFTAAATASSGTFGGGNDTPFGSASLSNLVVGDVDNDGDLDLMGYLGSSLTGSAGASGSGLVQFSNDGSGVLTNSGGLVRMAGPGAFFSNLQLCDFDGDGDLDLLHNGAGGRSIDVEINDGQGHFNASSMLVGGQNIYGLGGNFLADLDGDGDLDGFVSTTAGVQVLLNSGTGTFALGATLAGGYAWAGADFDGDGDTDIAGMSLQFNNGAGTFTNGPALGIPAGDMLAFVKAADVDGDNDADLVLSYYHTGYSALGSTLEIRLNDGTGNFSVIASRTVYAEPSILAEIADVNGDGNLDLLATSAAGIIRLMNTGSGNFVAGPSTPIPGRAGNIAVADIDGDGDLDLLATSFVSGSNSSGFLSTRFNLKSALAGRNGTVAGQLVVFPNPAKQRFQVQLPVILGSQSAQLCLRNALGQPVLNKNLQLTSADAVAELDATGLATGMYHLTVVAGAQQFTQRIVIE